jgi:hypothetical protein
MLETMEHRYVGTLQGDMSISAAVTPEVLRSIVLCKLMLVFGVMQGQRRAPEAVARRSRNCIRCAAW